MKKLVIDRSKWGCKGHLGTDLTGSLLSSSTGKMCCLGFLAKALGASDESIRDRPLPSAFQNVKWPPGTFDEDTDDLTDVIYDLAKLNDRGVDDAARETEIATEFVKLGYEVEFVGEY